MSYLLGIVLVQDLSNWVTDTSSECSWASRLRRKLENENVDEKKRSGMT